MNVRCIINNISYIPRNIFHKNEIIFALEWVLCTNMWVLTKKQDDFYIKYYGRTPYRPHKEGMENPYHDETAYDKKLVDEARIRTQKAFELFGYFYTTLGSD